MPDNSFEKEPNIAERPSRMTVEAERHPSFFRLSSTQQKRARSTGAALNFVSGLGHLELKTKKRIVDFGAGYGGTTLALAQLAEQNGGTVDAVEKNRYGVQALRELGFLPDEHLHLGDGIDYLRKRAQLGDQLDLITAFMFGPDFDGSLSGKLLGVAHEVAPEGQLLVTSDLKTLEWTRQACDQMGALYRYIPGDSIGPDIRPNIIISL